MVWGQIIGFNSCERIKFLKIANLHVFHVWVKSISSYNDTTFFFTIFPFFDFATQLFSTPVTSSSLRNQAPPFTELRLLQATHRKSYMSRLVTKVRYFLKNI